MKELLEHFNSALVSCNIGSQQEVVAAGSNQELISQRLKEDLYDTAGGALIPDPASVMMFQKVSSPSSICDTSFVGVR